MKFEITIIRLTRGIRKVVLKMRIKKLLYELYTLEPFLRNSMNFKLNED